MKKQIDDNSSKPLEQMKVVSEEELVLKGLRLKLKKMSSLSHLRKTTPIASPISVRLKKCMRLSGALKAL